MKNRNNMKYIVLFAGIVAFLFSSGKWNIPIMAFIWPFGILYFNHQVKTKKAFLISCGLLIICSSIKCYGFVNVTMSMEIINGALLGSVYCIPFLVERLIYKRLTGFISTLVLPLSFACTEFIMTLFYTLGPVSATQTQNLPLIQMVSIFGSYGITFLIVWFSSTLCYIFEIDKEKRIMPACIYGSVFVAVLIFGGARLAFSLGDTTQTVRMAVSTCPEWEENITMSFQQDVDSIRKSVVEAASGKAEILVFNETAYDSDDTEEQKMIQEVKTMAKDNNICILIGLQVNDTDNSNKGKSDNKVYFVDS